MGVIIQFIACVLLMSKCPNLLFLTLSDATFEKRRKVWKTIKELSETPCCYIEVGPISKWSSHEKNRVEISKTG